MVRTMSDRSGDRAETHRKRAVGGRGKKEGGGRGVRGKREGEKREEGHKETNRGER